MGKALQSKQDEQTELPEHRCLPSPAFPESLSKWKCLAHTDHWSTLKLQILGHLQTLLFTEAAERLLAL